MPRTSTIKESLDSKNITFLDRKIELKSLSIRCGGFVSMMACRRKSYHKIPENIRIWHGDDYLVQLNNESAKINYVINNVPIFTKMSVTSDLPEFEEIKNIDTLMYDRFVSGKGNIDLEERNK